jgi:RecB family exonuclease
MVFRSCALKGVLSRYAIYKDLVYIHPKARIGSVCHEILERIGRGEFDQLAEGELADQIEVLYKQLCLNQYTLAMQGVYMEKALPENWPGYYIRLARLKLIGRNLWNDRKNAVIRKSRQFLEQSVNVFDGKLKGRPDRFLFISQNELLIEDYKTGLIYDEDLKLSEGIRQQMLVYSAILHQLYPNSSIRFRVIPLKGAAYEELVNIEEAVQLAEEAVNLLEKINLDLSDIVNANKSFDDLAQPSFDNCVHCSYKPKCNKFFQQEFTDQKFISMKGKFVSYALKGSGFLEIILKNEFNNQNVVIRKLPGDQYDCFGALNEQSTIIITELVKKEDYIYESSLYTTVWGE